jgi:hypothetical protein
MCAIVRRIVRPIMSSSDTTPAPTVAGTPSYLAPVRRAEPNATSPEMPLWHLVCTCVVLRGRTIAEQPVNLPTAIYLGVFSRAEQRVLHAIFNASAEGAADVSLPWQCSPASQTLASQPRATRSPKRSQSAFSKRPSAALTARSRFPTF